MNMEELDKSHQQNAIMSRDATHVKQQNTFILSTLVEPDPHPQSDIGGLS